jgi:NAD(P)-dependent dehydrogenase (short-subunit alcohol dehydrogenase family)
VNLDSEQKTRCCVGKDPGKAPSILITGASSGFGLLTARLALSKGWRAIATARRPETIPLESAGTLLKLRLDVTDDGSIREAIRVAISVFGPVDAVVNNAGVVFLGCAEEIPRKDLRRQFEVSFFGAVSVAKAVLPGMRERRGGQLVFVSSDWGRTGIPGYSSYCAAKFALEGWVESLYHEMGAFGVGVTLIEPGAFDTGFEKKSLQEAPGASDPESPYAPLYRALRDGFAGEERSTGEPVAESILRAASGKEPRLRVPVGPDAIEWSTARFRNTEEEFILSLARWYGWSE